MNSNQETKVKMLQHITDWTQTVLFQKKVMKANKNCTNIF